MAEQGLEKIKLQDGYKKLLVSGLDSGIQGAMTEVSTSTGVNIAASVLYMGQGDVDAAPLLKIKARQTNGQFFKITDSGGTFVDGSDEYDILVFNPDGSGGSQNQGRGLWAGRCQIQIGDRGRIEFVDNDVQNLDLVPTIKKRASDSSVSFEVEENSSKYWSFDRLQIAPGPQWGNAAVFDAPGVNFSTGVITADGITMSASAVLDHQGSSTNIENTNDVKLRGHASNWLYGASDTYVEALTGDGEGDSSLWLDALSHLSTGTSPTIRIGTITTATRDIDGDGGSDTVYGAQNIIIGDNARTDAEINLNSKKVIFENSMIIQDLANGGVWTDGFDNSLIGSSQATYYSIDDGAAGIPGWYDGKTDSNFYLEKLELGHSRMPVYEGIENTTSTSPAATITTLSDGAFQVYVKDGKLIFACNDNGTARFFSFDGRSTGDITDLTYGTSEPA